MGVTGAIAYQDRPPLLTAPWRDSPAPSGPLAEDEIELVLAPHAACATLMPTLAALLTPGERAAAARFAAPAARDRAILSRATLRLLLSQHLATAPQDIDIAADGTGKPFVRDRDATGRPLAFNLSHAGDLLLFGFARAPVGVDLEPLQPIPRLDAFARMIFSERERAMSAALPAAQRLAHAYRIWVGKEALVKRSGEGIRRDFASFDLPEEDVTIFVPQAGFVAAVAGIGALRFRRISHIGCLLPMAATGRR